MLLSKFVVICWTRALRSSRVTRLLLLVSGPARSTISFIVNVIILDYRVQLLVIALSIAPHRYAERYDCYGAAAYSVAE